MCVLGCLCPCSFSSVDEAKPMLYTQITFSQANMLCSAFPRAGELPFSSAHLCMQTLDEKGHGRDAAASPSPAACPKSLACFDHLRSLLKTVSMLQTPLGLGSPSLLMVLAWCMGLPKPQKSHFWVMSPIPGSLPGTTSHSRPELDSHLQPATSCGS